MLKKLTDNWIEPFRSPVNAGRSVRNRLSIGLLGVILVGCNAENTIRVTGSVEGEPYEITVIHEGVSATVASEVISQAEKKLKQHYELLAYSGDVIEKLNEDRVADVPAEFENVAALAETIRNATEGAYDYRQAGVRDLWRFYNRNAKPPEVGELATALADVPNTVLEVKNGKASLAGRGMIDFGLLAQGSAVDAAADALVAGGIPKAKISLGQVVRTWGGKVDEGKNLWQVILPPLPEDSVYKVLTPPDGSIAYIHPEIIGLEVKDSVRARMLDPFTGQLSDSAIASVGWADEAAVAGAYAEAFFVMGRRNVFFWIEDHQPAGAYLVYYSKFDEMMLCETDAHLANCLSDSLPLER